MQKLILASLLCFASACAYAEGLPVFNGINFSGDYACKGKNESVGDYEVFVTLKLNYMNSHGNFGVYDFNTETNNKVIYIGQAITNGYRLSMTFKLSNSKNREYTTGIGQFRKIDKHRWAFKNTYYEPDDTGGNFGDEYCTMKPPKKPTINTDKNQIETK
jgi:hypothetical protein